MKSFLIGLFAIIVILSVAYGFGYFTFVTLNLFPTKDVNFGNIVILGTLQSFIFYAVIAMCYLVGQLIRTRIK